MEIKKVGVVGCGLMGHGITQASAPAGYDVVVREVSQEKLDTGLGKINKQLARAVEKGKHGAVGRRRDHRSHQRHDSTTPTSPTAIS